MMPVLKRPRDVFDTPPSSSPMPLSKRPAVARAQSSSSPTTAKPKSTSYVIPKHYHSSPWSSTIPHDSPSNPFGLNRALRALTLPRPSGFGKHIVFHLQVVSQIDNRPSSRSRPPPPQGPYRIVQVPLNYSFRLLHMLILFLFANDANLTIRRPGPPPVFSLPRKPQLDVLGESPKKDEGHLFEVFDDVSSYANHYRPGVIKPGSGKLYARLSSARERRLFPETDDDAEEMSTSPFPLSQSEGADDEGWDWEGEDDFVLSNVWPDGPDLQKGIIYHHTASTAVHITVNQMRLPPRKGAGNTPYVFVAIGGTNGAVRISNVASGPVPKDDDKENLTDRLALGRKRQTEGGKTEKQRPKQPDFILEKVDDLDDGEMATTSQLQRWNADDAYQRFLKRETARERAMRRHPDTPPSPLAVSKVSRSQCSPRGNLLLSASSPGAGPSSASPLAKQHTQARTVRSAQKAYGSSYSYAVPHAASSSSTLGLSSPSTLPVPLGMSSDVEFDFDAEDPSSDGEGETQRGFAYRIQLPLETPFPAHPAVRRRVTRVSKRIERATSKGLSEFDDSDEEETKKVTANTGAGGAVGAGQDVGKDNLAKTREEEEDDPEWGQGSPSKMPSSRSSSRCSGKLRMEENAWARKPADEDHKAKGSRPQPVANAPAPIFAAKGPNVFADEEDEEEERDELGEDYADDGFSDEEDNMDGPWDVGPTWFGPCDDDEVWSEDEL